MEILLWILVMLFFMTSLIGVIVPFIPDTLLVWAGFLMYRWTLAAEGFPDSFWWVMAAFTVLIIGADVISNLWFVKKYGGNKWSMLGAVIGLLVAPFLIGPLGILIGPFAVVFIMEWIRKQDWEMAAKVAVATLTAWFSSSAIKILLQIIMIVWFFTII